MVAPRDYVSHLGDPVEKLRHLDTMARLGAERKQRVYALLGVGEGQRVLDVGCGPGTDTLPLARLVGPSGHVSGVDLDGAMVEQANQRAVAAGVGAWAEHRVADASALPFADASFDACHAERVFLHLPDPAATFAELVRVLRPGGRLALIDADGATFSVDTPEADIERRIIPFWAAKHHNGYAGRQHYRFCRQHGLVDVAVEIHAGPRLDFEQFARNFALDDIQERALQAGAVTREEVGRFRASLEQAAATGAFFATGNVITVVGRKP